MAIEKVLALLHSAESKEAKDAVPLLEQAKDILEKFNPQISKKYPEDNRAVEHDKHEALSKLDEAIATAKADGQGWSNQITATIALVHLECEFKHYRKK